MDKTKTVPNVKQSVNHEVFEHQVAIHGSRQCSGCVLHFQQASSQDSVKGSQLTQ